MAQTTEPPLAPPSPPGGDRRSITPAMIALGLVAVALAVALVVALNDDDDVASVETTTAAPGGLSDAEAASVVWPAPGDADQDDAVLLVTDFAEELLGFTAPVVGEYQAGDSRSGEVEVRPTDDGPVTTVFEGQVRVAVRDRDTGEELGRDFFTAGASGDLAAFAGEVAWDNPGGGWGAVVASTSSGKDGSTWAATTFPVGFIGGD